MKNLNVLLKSLILVIGLVLFTNCNNENNTNLIEEDEKLVFDYSVDYGKIHNDGLKLYYEKYGNDQSSNLKEVFERLNDLNAKKNGKSKLTSDEINQLTNLFLNNEKSDTNNDFKLNAKFLNLLTYFEQKGFYSYKLTNLLSEIIKNNHSSATIANMITEFRSDKNISAKDDNVLYAFNSIYKASNDFWNDWEKNEGKKDFLIKPLGCNPRHQVRIADAAGGIFGGLFGALAGGLGAPVGASIGSQGLSAFVEEAQEQRGGACI